MSLLHLFQWVGHTALGEALRQSRWAFAIIEVLHLLALALFGGTVLLVNLRFWKAGLRLEPATKVAQALAPYMLASVLFMVVTGLLMVISGPMRYYYNTAFRWKMLLFVLGALTQLTLYRFASNDALDISKRQRLTAGLSLVLWIAVALAGRAIGYV